MTTALCFLPAPCFSGLAVKSEDGPGRVAKLKHIQGTSTDDLGLETVASLGKGQHLVVSRKKGSTAFPPSCRTLEICRSTTAPPAIQANRADPPFVSYSRPSGASRTPESSKPKECVVKRLCPGLSVPKATSSWQSPPSSLRLSQPRGCMVPWKIDAAPP